MKIWLATLVVVMVIFYAGWAAFTVLDVSVNEPVPVHFLPGVLQSDSTSPSINTTLAPLPPLFIAGELHSSPVNVDRAAEYNILHKISNDNMDLIVN
jgi:hypothetical protein